MHRLIVLMFLKSDRIFPAVISIAYRDTRFERMRLGNFIQRFQIALPFDHLEDLPCTIGAHGFDSRAPR